MSLSTHVLDATAGAPAFGVQVALRRRGESDSLASAVTDRDGRVGAIDVAGAGVYQLTFGTGEYFRSRGVAHFYPEVTITFEIIDPAARYHVPLLLSPFAYSTYRGS